MTAKNLLEQFLKEDSVKQYLFKNSRNHDKIKLLQLCLNDLGFGAELKFSQFGADGYYGKSTIRGVKAFMIKNNFDGNGEVVTNEVLEKMISLKETDTSKSLNDFLTQIKTTDTITVYLSRGSTHKSEIVVLQTALYNIGYEKALNWDRYHADGGYGQSTVSGVLAFIQKNNFEGNGETLTLDMFKQITKLDEVVSHLRMLDKIIATNQTIKKGSDKSIVRALQYMLHYLGYDVELNWDKYHADGHFGYSSIAAIQAFSTKENLTFDGVEVTTEILQKLIGLYESGLGNDWKVVQNGASFEDLTVKEVEKNVFEISDGIDTKSFTKKRYENRRRKVIYGMSLFGKQIIKAFLKNHKDLIRNHEISDSALRVIQAVEVNEGRLEGINSYDDAFFSFGIYQWTIGVDDARGELPALLKKIKHGHPETFQKHFGVYGLDVSDKYTDTTYGYLILNNKLIKNTSQKEQFRNPKWAFIFWKAAQDPIVQSYEIEHAISRFKNFYWVKNSKYLKGHSISEYITSEYGVALLLDQNVNRPNDVYVYTEKALDATGLKETKTWTTAKERRLIDKYIELRNGSKMTSARLRAKRTKDFLIKGLISDERNSFQYNRIDTIQIGNEVLPSMNFNQENHPKITENKEQYDWKGNLENNQSENF